MKRFGLLLVLLSVFTLGWAQVDTTKNIIDKAKIQYKLSEGKTKFYAHNYRGALNIYREVLVIDESNALAHYGVAECQYALKNFDAALEHIEDAYKDDPKVDKDVLYTYGMILHQLGRIDEAKEYYQKFRATIAESKTKLEDYDIDIFISQCDFAKAHAEPNPDIIITNLGSAVNSGYPEFAPVLSLDGKTLVFTSRRNDTKGGGLDIDFDHLYYSDVYQCTWNEEDQEWNKAEPIPGKINTEYHDGALSFTPEGELLLYRNIIGATKSGDIYYSKLSTSSGKWSAPKEMLQKEMKSKKAKDRLNSTYWESSATMTEDGNELYFVSERPGGQGQADIYYIKKNGREWSDPINLGTAINTRSDEKCVFIHPTGKVLFFSSNGHADGFGSYDLYYCLRDDSGNWGKPVNMGAPINTVKEEKTITVSRDGKYAYVGAYYKTDTRGDADIFQIDISALGIFN
ncbi:MAG: PD40 domain-containing protein [Flavobacteriales bacterium]|nr:PD40 domain-containing protein [Flavobacteriales bacterium]MCB9197007.1 PD40 domain-containing protein [Flavobacteriales bacterium]